MNPGQFLDIMSSWTKVTRRVLCVGCPLCSARHLCDSSRYPEYHEYRPPQTTPLVSIELKILGDDPPTFLQKVGVEYVEACWSESWRLGVGMVVSYFWE